MPTNAEYAWEADLYDWESGLDAPERTPVGGGGPQTGRKHVTNAERSQQAFDSWKRQPLHVRMTMAPDELMPGGMEARNKATADAGAVLGNIIADTTVNLPSHVAGFAGKVAGQVGRNFDSDIDPAQWRERAAGLLPNVRSQRGDELLGEVFAPAADAWQRNVTPTLERHPLLGAAAETAGTALEGLGWFTGGNAARRAVGETLTRDTATKIANMPHTRAPVADVAKRYTIVPDDAAHSAGVLPSKVTGSTRASLGRTVTDTEVPFKNIPDATRRVVEDMPQRNLVDANGRVDEGLLQGAIQREAVPYEQIKMLPAPTVNTLAGRLRQAWETRGGSLKGDAVAESRLAPLMDVEAAPLSTDELLLRWREINDYASQLRKAAGEGAPAAQIKGRDLRAIAEAILDEIDDRATAFGTPELVDNLKAARVNIARLHTLGDSLDNAGWVDPTKLVAMADRHEPLTGALAQLAADAKAAPRSLSPLKRAVDAASGNELDQFGRQPNSWLRNVAGHLGGNLLARRGVESLNRELRAGSGLLRQPVPETPVPPLWPPNAGPQPGPAAPQAPPGLFAVEPPVPRAPLMPSVGRPEPGGPAFNLSLADQLAGDLQLEGALPPAPPARAPQGRPLDVVDFERPAPPPAPGTFLEALTQDQLRIAPDAPMPFRLQGAADPFQNLGIPRARFGPADEFPDGGVAPAAPVAPAGPRGPAPSGAMAAVDDLIARHVTEGDVEASALAQRILDAGGDAPLPLRRAAEVYAGGEGSGAQAQRALLKAIEEYAGPVGFPDEVPVLPASPATSFADTLALAPDAGPASPRFDVTEALPGQSAGQFADQFLMPGAQRIEDAGGLIDYIPGELDWRITNQYTPPGMEGQGFATNRVLDLARRAQAEGMPLHSDVDITDAIARLMLGARDRGMLNFDEANALRMQQLLGEGQTRLRGSVPWFQNIRPATPGVAPGGAPREFIRFGDQAPTAPRFTEAANILRRFDDQDGGANPWMADTELLDELDALPDEALPSGVRDRIEQFRERRREDYAEDAGRGDSDEDLEAAIAEIRRLLGQ